RVDVHVEGDLAALPAAAEVAAYRIVQEALTNVYRHARAGHAVVRLRLNGDLDVSVQDDGIGPPEDLRGGVGMSSMRERAAELGGACTVSGRPEGGTLVRARLPLTGAPPGVLPGVPPGAVSGGSPPKGEPDASPLRTDGGSEAAEDERLAAEEPSRAHAPAEQG
ncbi:ATP-binding protein, partial [Spirillospora sp. NPDC049652]